MAFILQELAKFSDPRSRKDDADYNQQDLNGQSINYLQQKITNLLKKEKTMYFNLHKNQRSISIIIIYCNIIKTASLIFKMYIRKPYHISIHSKLLNFNLNYTLVKEKQAKKMVCKYLIDHDTEKVGNQCKLCIDMNTGQLKVNWPIYMIDQKINQKILSSILCSILFTVDKLKLLRQSILYISTMSNENPKYYLQEIMQKSKQRNKKLKKLYNYIENSTVILNLVAQSSTKELEIVKKEQRQFNSISNIKDNIQNIDKNYSFLQLYTKIDFAKYQQKQIKQKGRIFKLSVAERQIFQQKIMLPNNKNISKINNSQNYFVLNYIQLKKRISQNVVRKIKVGGFTTIYLSQIQYWYVLSSGSSTITNFQNYEKHLPAHKKCIVIKKQTYPTQPSTRNRVEHQIKILKQIKNGVSMFLPKYYLLADKGNPFQNDLLLDYIPFPNLSEYIKQNQHILSTNNKIFIIFMISQALRYLKEYQIAHLDLKPTNIMTYKKLHLKIIDFGQAFHPSLKDHEPGYSIPYAAPQNFKKQQFFNYKNDIFSLGIIIHEIFFSKYPYYIYSEKLRTQVFLQGDFRNYWFCSPQQKLSYGDKQIIQIIYQLMIKCLKKDSHQRPQLEWLSYVLRQLYDITQ